MGVLLERDRELRRIAELLGRCADGHGGIIVIDGPAGIGKTALLDAAVLSAQAAGIVSLRARGGELERGFGYSVIRDLFAPALSVEGLQRAELLTGAAGLGDVRPAGCQGLHRQWRLGLVGLHRDVGRGCRHAGRGRWPDDGVHRPQHAGNAVSTVSEASSTTTQRELTFAATGLTNAQHTIQVSAKTATPILLDGFVVLR